MLVDTKKEGIDAPKPDRLQCAEGNNDGSWLGHRPGARSSRRRRQDRVDDVDRGREKNHREQERRRREASSPEDAARCQGNGGGLPPPCAAKAAQPIEDEFESGEEEQNIGCLHVFFD